ncbi:MAG: HDOD domain-containing protein [Acidobacteria bacterium]|nr:HDOD domain-containing protein [Acidobacteriota bacterium]
MLPQEHHFPPGIQPAAPKVDLETLVDMKLPPSPGGVMRLTTVLRDYDASTTKVAEAINFEPSLVTRILRLANSPIYSLEKHVTTMQQAVNAVGTVTIHDIVMMELTSKTFSDAIYKSREVQTIWKHSLAVGLMARELSKILRHRGSEEAFVCGLLHDVGKILLLTYDSDGFLEAMEAAEGGETLRAETAKFGYSHAEVGALVARRWGLPNEVCVSILNHHDPAQAQDQLLITYIVDAANMIANIRGIGLHEEDPARLEWSESILQLGLTPEMMDCAWQTVESNLGELVKAFE